MTKSIFGYLFGIGCLGLSVANLPATPSLSANTELICHTENRLDCYPRIFQPTEDFQVVYDDQDLPPGLHVRLNINTGEKEARLNIPMGDEAQPGNAPTEQAVIVVPQPEVEGRGDEPALRDRVQLTPLGYEAAGKIMPPRGSDGIGGDSEIFTESLHILSGSNPPRSEDQVNLALSTLLELSHDIYYGVELAKRGDVVQHLVSLMSFDDPESSSLAYRRRQAASIVGGSVQNNPTALKEIKRAWNLIVRSHCERSFKGDIACGEEGLVSKVKNSIEQENDPAVMKAKIYALNGLTKDREMRDSFLAKGGMELLLSISLRQGENWGSTRMRIYQFVTDTFLDGSMGAELGIWPQGPVSDHNRCSVPKHSTEDGCWEYHLEKASSPTSLGVDEELKTEFLKLMKQGRSSSRVARQGREL
jgi:nucleotide exchange factor SIL1